MRSPRCSAAILSGLLSVSGCVRAPDSSAAPYRPDAADPIPMTVPETAPYISQQFYMPEGSQARAHKGFDIVGQRGRPVLAAAPGVVLASFGEPVYGNRVTIRHGVDDEGRTITTDYRHLDARMVAAGDVVGRGDQIGTMGATGVLAGLLVHLHFEISVGRRGSAPDTKDPNLYWADGVGRFTCFDPGRGYPDHPFRITAPTPCD